MITCFKIKVHKSKLKNKNCKKTLTTIFESVDTEVIIGGTTKFVTLTVTGVGLMVMTSFARIVSALSLSNKVLPDIFINKFNRY